MADIVYATIAEARARSEELMAARQTPGNPNGDGKPYQTTRAYQGLINRSTGEGALVVPDDHLGLLTGAERANARSPISADFVPDDGL